MTPSYNELINLKASPLFLFFLPFIALGVIYRFMVEGQEGNFYSFSFEISNSEIFIYLSFLFILTLLSVGLLGLSLSGDEIAYSQTGVIHGLEISRLLSETTSFFDQIGFKYLVQLFSFLSLIALLAIIFFSRKISSDRNRIFLFVFLLLVTRILVSLLGGNTYAHPPLSSLFPLIFGSFFGINELTFKLSYFIPYSIFIFILYKELTRKLDAISSFLLCLAFSTIPILLSLGSVVEQSLWSVICYCLIITKIISKKNPNYFNLVILVTIFSFFRITSIFALIPVFAHFLIISVAEFSSKDFMAKNLRLIIPVFAILPFLGFTIFYSTHYSQDQSLSDSSIFIESLLSGEIFSFVLSSFNFYWLVPIIFSFFLPSFKGVKTSLIIFAFCLLTLFYFLNNPMLWGISKYQAEYVLPFILSGSLLFLHYLSKSKLIVIGRLVLLTLAILNTWTFTNFPSNCEAYNLTKSEETHLNHSIGWPFIVTSNEKEIGHFTQSLLKGASGCNIISNYPYNSKEAYNFILELKKESYVYSPGVHYGVLPQIMSGFDVKSIKSVNKILKYQDEKKSENNIPWVGGDAQLINSDTKIQLVVLDLVSSKDKLIRDLLQFGWIVVAEFKDSRYKSSVLVLSRK